MGRWKQLNSGNRVDEFFRFDEVGKELMGAFKGTFVTTSGTWGDQTNAIIETPEGMTFGVSLTRALRDLEHLDIGDGVRLVYLGKQMSKAGNEFKAFDVFVWDAEDEPTTVEQPPRSETDEPPPFEPSAGDRSRPADRSRQ